MGRYNLAPTKVHAHATQLLRLGKTSPPPWYHVVGSIPSSEVLTRMPMQKKSAGSRRASKMFKPVQLEHREDNLRWEFFNDHPWELARPRIVLENDGRDAEKWDWSHSLCRPALTNDPASMSSISTWEQKQRTQAHRPLNGESVVQRQKWLMDNTGLSQAAAYDAARKELYIARHALETQQRVAKEEAAYYGGSFGPGALEKGMELEDKAYEHFRAWAATEVATARQHASAAYTGEEVDEVAAETTETDLETMLDNLPGSKQGQEALGGAAITF